MSFTGSENHGISLEAAAELTARFRETISEGDIIGGFFGKDAVRDILQQTGCVGMRYYYGLDENEKPVLVLVGVDSDGNDMYDGELAELAFPCPDNCPSANPLNSNS